MAPFWRENRGVEGGAGPKGAWPGRGEGHSPKSGSDSPGGGRGWWGRGGVFGCGEGENFRREFWGKFGQFWAILAPGRILKSRFSVPASPSRFHFRSLIPVSTPGVNSGFNPNSRSLTPFLISFFSPSPGGSSGSSSAMLDAGHVTPPSRDRTPHVNAATSYLA